MQSADREETLPTRAEVAMDDDLDGSWAIKNFHGKTLAEAEALFGRDGSLNYTESLWCMEPIGFLFYVRAAICYGLSERANGDSDFINGMAGALSHWLEYHPAELIPCARLLADFCGTIFRHFDRYDADPDIYVGLGEKYHRLAERFVRMADEHGTR